MIKLDKFAELLGGFVVVDCFVVQKDALLLLAQEDYCQWTDWKDEGDYPDDECLEKRLIQFSISLPEGQSWNYLSLEGLDISRIGMSFSPKKEMVISDIGGTMFSVEREGVHLEETPYDHGNEARRGSVIRLKTIDDVLYLCGGNRVVAVRQGRDNWKWMTPFIPLSQEERKGRDLTVGFEDIDGFSQNDVYAVGAQADVWHFNGEKWRRVDFPSNEFIFTVCCAGDGQVYIGARSGVVYRGRGDTWQRLKDPKLSLPFRDMVWYEDRLWCTNDYGVWWVNGDEVVDADVPSSVFVCSGNLSARDGVLLLAGLHGAAYLENGQWNMLFDYADMYKQCKEAGKLDGVLRARWHEFSD